MTLRRVLALAVLLGATPAFGADYGSLERAIIQETDKLRADPKAYARELKDWKNRLKGSELTFGSMYIKTKEGGKAIDEAIAALTAAKPLSRLTRDQGMDKAARDHVKDQGKSGGKGHEGSDGRRPSQRIKRYGATKSTHENISYGPYFSFESPGKALVIQLLIDDGVKDRGHRQTLLEDGLTHTGVACGPHPQTTLMCVMTYAKDFKPRS